MQNLFDEDEDGRTPAEKWEADSARRALDDLFTNAQQYRTSAEYYNLLQFIARFRAYSPFNAMLVYTQLPGARFVAPAHRWLKEYRRCIRSEARPLVILQPMGPVMFVFDVSDTVDAEPDYPVPLPTGVTDPFAVTGASLPEETWRKLLRNAIRDGIEIAFQQVGSQSAGKIQTATRPRTLSLSIPARPEPKTVGIPCRYELFIHADRPREEQCATLIHELAHLYCGHLGTPDPAWWPDRRGLSPDVEEFEAESVSYLLCRRWGIHTTSEQYLAGYVEHRETTPTISLDAVLKAAGQIEQMGRESLPLRKESTRR